MLSFIIAASLGASGFQGQPGLQIQRLGAKTALKFSKGETFRVTDARVGNARVVDVPGAGARLVVWDEIGKRGAQPYYAISLDGRTAARVAESDYELKLIYATFDPLQAVPPVPPELEASPANEVQIVQFVTQPLPEFRTAIEKAGGIVTYYLANHAYVVRMDAKAKQRVSRLPYVRWIGPYEPAYRIAPDVRQQMERGTLGTKRYNVQVYQYGLEQKARVADWIRAMGGEINELGEPGYVFEATLTPGQLRQVSQMNDVFWVDAWSPIEADMNIARDFGGANYIESLAGYSGQGVRAQVRDTGLRQTHVDFAGRVTVRQNTTSTSHGTNVSGITFGSGAANSNGRGMLPSGHMIFLSGLTTGSTRYNETQALLQAPYWGVFETNSTGNNRTRLYTTDSFTIDDIQFRMNILICQSQSNAGNQDSRPQAWGKQTVSVGGVKHMNTLTRADDNWTFGGSIGPAADGRIKPDLAHFYDNITCASSTSDTSYTSSFGGTSGATPITAGHFGLFFQLWSDGVFGNSVSDVVVSGNRVFDTRPMNMTAKALMINTATQWTFSGATHDLTRTHQGWGSADVRNLYDLRNKMFVVDETDVLTNLQTKTYKLVVPAGEPAFRATMAYNDPPGTTSSTLHRINDLTLKVTSPGGTVYYGNNGLLANMWSTSGGTSNTVDTVENVFVQNPQSGVWTVEVSGDQIVQDARLETGGVIDADYALVVSGVAHSVLAESFSATIGTHLGGGLAALHTSNNQVMRIGPSIDVDSIFPSGELTLNGTSPTASLSQLRFRVEAKGTLSGATMKVYLRNFATGVDVLQSTTAVPTTDGVVEVAVTSGASNFVQAGTRAVRAKVVVERPITVSDDDWQVWIDQARWFVFGQ